MCFFFFKALFFEVFDRHSSRRVCTVVWSISKARSRSSPPLPPAPLHPRALSGCRQVCAPWNQPAHYQLFKFQNQCSAPKQANASEDLLQSAQLRARQHLRELCRADVGNPVARKAARGRPPSRHSDHNFKTKPCARPVTAPREMSHSQGQTGPTHSR